jgi:NADH-quinone oxidoreductase subunit L
MFAFSPITMEIVLAIGALTAFYSATIAVAQNDIKKILAYSTISQLGFMFMAMGVGAFSTGIFHVTTHAFFKALMFLGAGSVIHSLHDERT